jgi:hypothetical protein
MPKHGPNVARLIAHRMVAEAIPPGGGITDGVRFLTNREAVVRAQREAEAFARDAIAVVRTAADPNPWRDASDEAIAGEILRAADERKRGARAGRA